MVFLRAFQNLAALLALLPNTAIGLNINMINKCHRRVIGGENVMKKIVQLHNASDSAVQFSDILDQNSFSQSSDSPAPFRTSPKARRNRALVGAISLIMAGSLYAPTGMFSFVTSARAADSIQIQHKQLPVKGADTIMAKKAHGTSERPVQNKLRWDCDVKLADRICNFNRNWAEFAGYWKTTSFLTEARAATGPIKFYDSVSGKLLFTAPIGRNLDAWLEESSVHGWPSFRDDEVRALNGIYTLMCRNWQIVLPECVIPYGTQEFESLLLILYDRMIYFNRSI